MERRNDMFVKTVDYRSPTAPYEFVKSLKETGFTVLSHHPIPHELIDKVYKEWAGFFASQSKFDYLFDPTITRQAGYLPFKSENAKGNPVKDLKEYFHYRDKFDLPKGMSENTQLLFDCMASLGVEALKWLEAGLPADIAKGLSCPLHKMVQGSDMSLLRILHYPPLVANEEERAERAAPHEDINPLTILPAATATGLQVMDSRGNWHEVSCDYGTLVFNAGDMMQLATKGFYKSTTHRVVNPVGAEVLKSRYSMPLFLHAHKDVRLSETKTADSYLTERLQEVGLMSESKAA